MKWSVPESVLGRASVHTRNATFGTIFAPLLKGVVPDRALVPVHNLLHQFLMVSATLRFTILYSVNLALKYSL